MLVADRGTFEAKAAELEARLQMLQERLMDDTLSAEDLASLPIDISDTRQALKVIRARIAAFEITDCDKAIAEYEAQIAEMRPIVEANIGKMNQMRDWEILHSQTVLSVNNDQAAVEKSVELYADVLKAHVTGRAALWKIDCAIGQIAELKRQKAEAEKRRAAVSF